MNARAHPGPADAAYAPLVSALARQIHRLAREPAVHYVPIDPREVAGFDRRHYARATRELEALGFRLFGDFEPVHHADGGRLVMRMLASRQGTIAAVVVSLPADSAGVWARWLHRLGLGAGTRVVELQTEFTDHGFVLTHDAPGTEAFESPPAIDRHAVAPGTALRELFEIHGVRMKEHLDTRPGAVPRRFVETGDVFAAHERQRRARVAHRLDIGLVSDTELRELTGDLHPTLAPLVRREVLRLEREHAAR